MEDMFLACRYVKRKEPTEKNLDQMLKNINMFIDLTHISDT